MATPPRVPASPPPRVACPRCATPLAMLTLLTSMTRYYGCAYCGHRWNEAIAIPPDGTDTTETPIERV